MDFTTCHGAIQPAYSRRNFVSLNIQHQITAYNYSILKDMVQTLAPFVSATNCVQGEKAITGNMVIPFVCILKSEMEVLCSKYCSKFVATLKDSLLKRLSHYEEHDGFLTAAALDPRFKLQWGSKAEMPRHKYSLIAKAVNIAHNQPAFSLNEIIPNPEPAIKKPCGLFSSLIHVPVNGINTQSCIEL
ncbi:hypothetical protein LOD99_1548 [Oopsacas minuta]|uniref:Uncharacterized protein n=1 Tax=Oopsacas minuta TaxID=111878 RepID=A0AAV7K6C7_9METZ|nr:hypothetical protein LOD99_1548 [Oopsacas minuta]